ncbi:protein mono-ADP-ribosyltransferase PARP16 [Leguminivora glycinivorella]|uniref:protein mono-ADP-ribosyltransferase PARP16 n=1 Tax=Leguminivora glycinivorella TaxID=1035111 RepID=UPI00200F5099|nr:protein mono-ADP-ribosyltransferase PARP16 [Leguminivora glycinivorella]
MEKQPDVLSDTGTIYNIVSTSEVITDNSQPKLDNLAKKALQLRCYLEKDFKACDIKWSLFVAAAFSFRYESCLKPFPPAFLKNGVKDMDELLSVVSDVPALDLVLEQLVNLDDLSKVSDIIHLLFYVLVRLKEPVLKTLQQDTYEHILNCVDSVEPVPRPQYIFQVSSTSKSNAEQKWKEMSKNHNVFFAYHGSHLENFYSMLSFSVQQHLNKQSTMVGNGLYLTSELSASLPYSRGGFGWGASCIGGHISCVALCEVIDAPEGINYQKPTSSNEGYSGDTAGAGFERHAVNPRAAAHYIVTNSDLIRLRYILVYAKQPTFMRFPTTSGNRNNERGLCQWVSRHKLFSILLGYGLMLATIGFANNQPVHHYYESLLSKFDF